MSETVKNNLSGNVEESSKKFLDPDAEADDFPYISVLYCSQIDLWENVHEDPIISLYVKLVTDRQTDKRRILT